MVAVLPLNVAIQSLAAIMASDGVLPDAQTESKRVTWLFHGRILQSTNTAPNRFRCHVVNLHPSLQMREHDFRSLICQVDNSTLVLVLILFRLPGLNTGYGLVLRRSDHKDHNVFMICEENVFSLCF